jgi:excisionase family DNA binding protein
MTQATTAAPAAPLCHSVAQAAALLGIGRSTCWALIRSGELKSIRIARRVLVTDAELRRFVEGRAEAAGATR